MPLLQHGGRCFLAATGARKKPCRQSGTSTCRATFWPVFIDTIEHAQQIAGHASPRTTKLYDRTADTVTLDEIERIVI